MKRILSHCLVFGVGILLILCVITPFVIIYRANEEQGQYIPPDQPGMIISRKALADNSPNDRNYNVNELKFQIAELERIKVSVRNEMRELEKKRNSIIQETESHKASYYSLQSGLHKGRKELNVLQNDLTNAGHKLFAATPPPNIQQTQPPPIFILSDISPNDGFHKESHKPIQDDISKGKYVTSCETDISTCIDFAKCPLSTNLKFYIYPPQTYLPGMFKHNELLERFTEYLQKHDSLVSDPKEACLYIVMLGPFERNGNLEQKTIKDILHSLQYWRDDGSNHVLINLMETIDSLNLLDKFNPLKAIVVHNSLSSYHRHNFDVFIPLVGNVFTSPSLWKQLPRILPAHRKFLLYYSGGEMEDNLVYNVLKMLSQHLTEPFSIELNCKKRATSTAQEYQLCDNEEHRFEILNQSTFAIVPMSNMTGLVRLKEALRCGSIPVIVMTGASLLPFQSVIDWSQGAVIIPHGRLGEIHFILRSIPDVRILELRRQARFLYETYFSSLFNVLTSVSAILTSRLSHPPPPIQGVRGKLKKFGPDFEISSPSFQYNFSVFNYRYWNSPPGATPMFPNTPWDAGAFTGNEYSKMTNEELNTLPPHILQDSGITGPFFENYLLGDKPVEYFTIVMLTYKREEIVLEAVERFDNLKFLAKVIVVWNDLEKSPYDLKWPEISVPLEVIWAEKNSLNNRFLPFDSIQTEAVLSIDDDVYLRHDEIQFAFRVWRESRDRLVGFPGRFHGFDVRNRKWLYNSNYTCELSMVLTGAAFYHKYYSYLYSQWQPQAVLELVDNVMNCEDIAMNFLIAHITRKPPLKVTSRWTFNCPSCPDTLSQSDAHFNERHTCINTLTEIYGYTPLLYTQFRLDSVLFKTRLPSHLEKCYQYV